MFPWQAEFRLNAESVRALISSQCSPLEIRSVRYLGEGWDSAAYRINEEWVFRFPKRRERQAWLDSEIAVLGLLKDKRFELSVPVPEFLGKAGTLYPCGFMGYRWLAGMQADRFDVRHVNRSESARLLGELLTTVHSIEAGEADVRGVQFEELSLAEALEETVAMRDTVLPRLPADLHGACLPFLEGACAVPEPTRSRRCLVHGDLVDEHILLNEAGCVSGVIDWSDASIGDPSIDFGGLHAWLGEHFVREVLSHYCLPWDGSFLEQVAFRARCAALTTYGWSVQGCDTSQANRLQLVYTAFGCSANGVNERDVVS
jgi:aminoglycoside phosphotransferase (APT) family kinase protein